MILSKKNTSRRNGSRRNRSTRSGSRQNWEVDVVGRHPSLYPPPPPPTSTMKKMYMRHIRYEHISQLLRFARVCSHVEDFNARNKCLTAKLLKQGNRYHKLRKVFFQVLSPTQGIDFKILCRIKISFTLRPIGTRI